MVIIVSEYESVKIEEAMKRKYPEQVCVVTTVDSGNIPNAIVLGWEMITSGNPPMVAISIGNSRYSYELLRKCGEFVMAFPFQKNCKDIHHFSLFPQGSF